MAQETIRELSQRTSFQLDPALAVFDARDTYQEGLDDGRIRRPSGHVRYTLVDGETKLARFAVVRNPSGFDLFFGRMEDFDGTAWGGFLPTPLSVMAESEAYDPITRSDVVLADDQAGQEPAPPPVYRFDLRPVVGSPRGSSSIELRGHVRSTSGDPASEWDVRASERNGAWRQDTVTKTNGMWSITQGQVVRQPQEIDVSFRRPGSSRFGLGRRMRIRPGVPATVDQTSLYGRAVDSNKRSLDAQIRIDALGQTFRVETDSNGSWRLYLPADFPPGGDDQDDPIRPSPKIEVVLTATIAGMTTTVSQRVRVRLGTRLRVPDFEFREQE